MAIKSMGTLSGKVSIPVIKQDSTAISDNKVNTLIKQALAPIESRLESAETAIAELTESNQFNNLLKELNGGNLSETPQAESVTGEIVSPLETPQAETVGSVTVSPPKKNSDQSDIIQGDLLGESETAIEPSDINFYLEQLEPGREYEQKDIANLFGLKENTLSNIVTGKTQNPRLPTAKILLTLVNQNKLIKPGEKWIFKP